MKKLYTIFFLVFSIQFVYSQSGWFWQNPLPQGNDLNQVIYLNNQTIFGIGYYNTFIRSTDGGNSWSNIEILPFHYFRSAYFFDYNTGYISCDAGNVLKTINGGLNWNVQYTGVNFVLEKLFFISGNIGYLIANDTSFNGKSYLYKTTNAASNWLQNFADSNCVLNSINFTSTQIGYIAGNNKNILYRAKIFKTTNQGITWDSLPLHIFSKVSSLYFLNDNTGYISCDSNNSQYGRIYKTTNGGLSWIPLPNYNFYAGLNYSQFINENLGFTINLSTAHFIFKTNNGGLNWVGCNPTTSFNLDVFAYSFNDSLNGIIGGQGGIIYKTTNGSINWSTYKNSRFGDILSIYFINSLTGFAGGNYQTILKTTNSGNNWDSVNIVIPHITMTGINSIQFCDENSGYAGGDWGFLAKTTDCGISWLYLSTNDGDHVYGLSFPNVNTGYIVTKYGGIYKTSNAGGNWIVQIAPRTNGKYFNSCKFLDVNTGFAAGNYLYKTTNGGINWFDQNIEGWYNSIYFVDNQTGYAVGYINNNGYQGSIYKTTDAGNSWNQTIYGNQILSSVYFPSYSTGYITTWWGEIVKTTNSGVSWQSYKTITPNSLYSTFFINDYTGYLGGLSGTILKTTTGGVPIGIKPISNSVPDKFILYQNYPNPFNPTTKIKFDIPTLPLTKGAGGMNTKLTIYDILGREVTTLINENIQPGTYEIEWNAANFASGVYFYQLRAGDFVQTKKLVLLK